MKRSIVMLGLAGALAVSALAVPQTASASCADRKVTGTVLGGIGGALIGNSISRGGGGAVIGGLGGAVLGHEIARSGCRGYGRAYYYGPRYRERAYYAEPRRARYVYYDQYGNAVPRPDAAPYRPRYGYAGAAGCRTDYQSYYDDRGVLVQRPVQICSR